MDIQKTAILGAGTMGSALAALLANAGTDVILLDIVPENAGNRRSKLAEDAVEKMIGQERSPFTQPENAQRIICGNFEDDLEKIRSCDWILEAVAEDPEIKKDLYKRIDKVRKLDSIISSNTSTLTLKQLKEGQSPELKNDLVIAHFFNPPRQMRLLELTGGKAHEYDEKIQALMRFSDICLGKTVVEVNDTPGFIGNRLGIFWMMTGLQQALHKTVPVAMADSIMGKKLGFPKTGIFGLFDFIGKDMTLHLARSMRNQLPEGDAFHALDDAFDFLENMKTDSFYKKEKEKKLCLDFQTGEYKEIPAFSVDENLQIQDILNKKTEEANYARSVLLRTLNYACACMPEAANDVADADTVMRLGFNWDKGPFETIDSLGNKYPGTARLIEELEKENLTPAPFLQKARSSSFYTVKRGQLFSLLTKDGYKPKFFTEEKWTLADRRREEKPVLENNAAKLWYVGDGICCLEITSIMNTITDETFDLIEKSIETVGEGYAGLIIGDDDKDFSAGLNLNFILKACDDNNWKGISRIIRRGQKIMMALKEAPFPVVGAAYGRALGGGCEMLLHCDAIQAHMETHAGLVEVHIGVVPSWGGSKEMLFRHVGTSVSANSKLLACDAAFDIISSARISSSAEEFRSMISAPDKFYITINRERLLPDAKARCISLARNYAPSPHKTIKVPKAAVKSAYTKNIRNRVKSDQLTHYEKKVLKYLAYVLSGGNVDPEFFGDLELQVIADRMKSGKISTKVSEWHVMDLEHDVFMSLIRNEETQRKIRNIL